MLVVQEALAALSSQVLQYMKTKDINPARPLVSRLDPARSWVDPHTPLDNEDEAALTSPFKATSRSSVKLNRNSSVIHKSVSTPTLHAPGRRSMLSLSGQYTPLTRTHRPLPHRFTSGLSHLWLHPFHIRSVPPVAPLILHPVCPTCGSTHFTSGLSHLWLHSFHTQSVPTVAPLILHPVCPNCGSIHFTSGLSQLWLHSFHIRSVPTVAPLISHPVCPTCGSTHFTSGLSHLWLHSFHIQSVPTVAPLISHPVCPNCGSNTHLVSLFQVRSVPPMALTHCPTCGSTPVLGPACPTCDSTHFTSGLSHLWLQYSPCLLFSGPVCPTCGSTIDLGSDL